MRDDRGDEVDALLSPDRLSGREHELILDQVLDATASRPSRGRRTWRWIAAPMAVAATLVLYWGWSAKPGDRGYVGARGGSGAEHGLSIDVACLGAELTRCPLGSDVVFKVSKSRETGYLVAYAEPRGSGERVWYFSAESESPVIAANDGRDQPLGRGVRLGAEHGASLYDVHVLVARRPLTRAEALVSDARSLLGSRVVSLVVQR